MKKKTTQIFVNIDSYLSGDHPARESYSSWSREYSFEVKSVNLEAGSRYETETFTIPGNVKSGDTVYVLSMIYSDGDSFGNSTGHGEVIWVFTNEKVALEADKIWSSSNKAYSVEFPIEDGTIVKLSNPALGYFNNISYMNVESFLVE
jgi:hypothetical protein